VYRDGSLVFPRRVKTLVRLLHPQGNEAETSCGLLMALFRLIRGPVAVGSWSNVWLRRLDMVEGTSFEKTRIPSRGLRLRRGMVQVGLVD
jgi:hypothetical protein